MFIICRYLYIHVCIHIYIQICVYYICTYVCTSMYVYIYKDIYIYIYIYIYTYPYMSLPLSQQKSVVRRIGSVACGRGSDFQGQPHVHMCEKKRTFCFILGNLLMRSRCRMFKRMAKCAFWGSGAALTRLFHII